VLTKSATTLCWLELHVESLTLAILEFVAVDTWLNEQQLSLPDKVVVDPLVTT
jgi:hypothetical protein